jgi:hypothetical protein
MKNIGRLLMFISIIIGVLIDCNVFKESIEIPIIVSGITFLLGIYILMLCENKRYQIITYIITLPCSFKTSIHHWSLTSLPLCIYHILSQSLYLLIYFFSIPNFFNNISIYYILI